MIRTTMRWDGNRFVKADTENFPSPKAEVWMIRGEETRKGDPVTWMSGGTWDGIVVDAREKPSGRHDVLVNAIDGNTFWLKDAEMYGIGKGTSRFVEQGGYVREGNKYVLSPTKDATIASRKTQGNLAKVSDASATREVKGRFQEHIAGRNWIFEWTAHFGDQPGPADGVSVSKPAEMPDYIWEQNSEAIRAQAEDEARQQWRRFPGERLTKR